MGYFPNGTSGDIYEAQYCSRCIHRGLSEGPGCAVMLAHLVHNYAECNKPDSILHMLIPREADGFNGECKLFIDDGKVYRGKLPDHLREFAAKNGLIEARNLR